MRSALRQSSVIVGVLGVILAQRNRRSHYRPGRQPADRLLEDEYDEVDIEHGNRLHGATGRMEAVDGVVKHTVDSVWRRRTIATESSHIYTQGLQNRLRQEPADVGSGVVSNRPATEVTASHNGELRTGSSCGPELHRYPVFVVIKSGREHIVLPSRDGDLPKVCRVSRETGKGVMDQTGIEPAASIGLLAKSREVERNPRTA